MGLLGDDRTATRRALIGGDHDEGTATGPSSAFGLRNQSGWHGPAIMAYLRGETSGAVQRTRGLFPFSGHTAGQLGGLLLRSPRLPWIFS